MRNEFTPDTGRDAGAVHPEPKAGSVHPASVPCPGPMSDYVAEQMAIGILVGTWLCAKGADDA